ncbi:hypothetical protein BGZ65_005858, partial [Modicella reniformis]
IPAARIHFNKRAITLVQDEHQVWVTFSDGSKISGDILVGADGAYSSIRQFIYKDALEKGILPKVDTENLSQGFITMVGTTDPLWNLEKYHDLKDDHTHFAQMIGKKGTPYTWSTFTVPDRKICWSVQLQLGNKSAEQMFHNSEWTPEANERMIQDIYDFKTPYGILGELIDATPKDRISKVALEDKLFTTWHHGRCVLIGDGRLQQALKALLLPSAGQGAVNALQDAVILANCLYDLPSLSTQDITAAFKDYHEQRLPFVTYQFNASKTQAKILFGQGLFDRIIRHVAFHYLPQSLTMREVYKAAAYRPQATFIPLVEKRGLCDVAPQKPSKRYTEEQEAAVKNV